MIIIKMIFTITEPTHPSSDPSSLAQLYTKQGLPSTFVDKNTSPLPDSFLVPMYSKTPMAVTKSGWRGDSMVTFSSTMVLNLLHVLLPFRYKIAKSYEYHDTDVVSIPFSPFVIIMIIYLYRRRHNRPSLQISDIIFQVPLLLLFHLMKSKSKSIYKIENWTVYFTKKILLYTS